MENKNSNSLMLLTGVIAGAATVYFLKSTTGRKVIDLLLEKGEQLKEEITDQADAIIDKSKEKVEVVKETGNELLEKAEVQMAQAKAIISKTAEESQSDFEAGIKKAVSNLKNA